MLAFLRRRSMSPGWVACVPDGERLRATCVERAADGRAAVRWATETDWRDASGALRALRRSHALARHRSVALLQRGQYQLLPMSAPDVPREDWKSALRWQLQDAVDFPVDSAAVDLLELPSTGAAASARLLAVAAAQAAWLPLARAAEDAGAPWSAIDIPETALRNVCALVAPPGRAQALLHVQAHGTLVVTLDGELLAARTLDISAARLADADDDARRQAFDNAGLELQRTLDNFERQFSQVALSQLLVAPCPGAADFARHLAELVYVPVRQLELGEAMDLSAVPELADPIALGAMLPALGAALRND